MYMRTNRLVNGMVLERDVEYEGRVIFPVGTVLTDLSIAAFQVLGIDGMFVNMDEKHCIELPEACISAEVSDCLKKICCHDVSGTQIAEYVANFYYTTKYIRQLRNFDNYTYEHSMSVFTLSMLLGIHLCLSNEQMTDLGLAALTHDIGKLFLPTSVLNKKSTLSDEERQLLVKHSVYSRDIMKKYGACEEVVRAVYQHHENWDGSGYPEGASEQGISRLAQIIHVADVYDAYVGMRVYHNNRLPIEGYTYVCEHEGSLFAPEVVEVFKNVILPYPAGTPYTVNDQHATVVANKRGDSMHPIVALDNGTLVDTKKLK